MEKVTVRPKPDRRSKPRIPSEEIARYAYERYQQRGREHGHDLDDWLQAECCLGGRPISQRSPLPRAFA